MPIKGAQAPAAQAGVIDGRTAQAVINENASVKWNALLEQAKTAGFNVSNLTTALHNIITPGGTKNKGRQHKAAVTAIIAEDLDSALAAKFKETIIAQLDGVEHHETLETLKKVEDIEQFLTKATETLALELASAVAEESLVRSQVEAQKAAVLPALSIAQQDLPQLLEVNTNPTIDGKESEIAFKNGNAPIEATIKSGADVRDKQGKLKPGLPYKLAREAEKLNQAIGKEYAKQGNKLTDIPAEVANASKFTEPKVSNWAIVRLVNNIVRSIKDAYYKVESPNKEQITAGVATLVSQVEQTQKQTELARASQDVGKDTSVERDRVPDFEAALGGKQVTKLVSAAPQLDRPLSVGAKAERDSEVVQK